MRILVFICISTVLCSCTKHLQEVNHFFEFDKDSMPTDLLEKPPVYEAPIQNPLKTGKLKLLVTNNTNTFFIYKGESLGLEFEILKLFLADHQMDLEIVIIDDLYNIRDSLHTMGAHVAAATFIIPDEPMSSIIYSQPIYTSDLVLVKNKSNTSPTNHVTLLSDAPYVHYLMAKDREALKGLEFNYTTEATTKELLLEKVHLQEIEATIVDANEAAIMLAIHPDLVIEKVIEKEAPVGFMFHSKMDTLRNEFNRWLAAHKGTSDYAWVLKKYASLPEQIVKIDNLEGKRAIISLYDDIIKEHASEINWDWRLIASMIHQESHFNPGLKSWVGACGLMQLMPKTAKEYANVTGKYIFVPKYNISAGTKYIGWLENNFFQDSMITSAEKQKFIIASYNAGPGHIADARALCSKYKLNPNVWENNVEKMVLAKSHPKYYKDPLSKHGYCRGSETIAYVNNIYKYYGWYVNYY